MPRLIWSPSALAEVQRLYRLLARNNIDAARRAFKSIREGVKVLALQHGIGQPAADMEPEYRKWIIERLYCPVPLQSGYSGDSGHSPPTGSGLLTWP